MKQPSGTCKFLLAMLLSLLSACASVDFDIEQEPSFAIPASLLLAPGTGLDAISLLS